MKINFKGILEGVWNSVFIKESIEQISQERLNICKACDKNSDNAKRLGYKTFRPDFHCSLCGCNLELKTRSLSEVCPSGKWGAYLTDTEELELQEKLKNDSYS